MSSSSDGQWLARCEDGPHGKRVFKTLGDFALIPPSQRYDAARRAAEEWFSHLADGGSTEIVTVRIACERYVARLRSSKGADSAEDAAKRFKRHVYPHTPLALTDMTKLASKQIRAWRAALVATAVTVGKGENSISRPRSSSANNRDMTAFRAALNFAFADGAVTSDHAWKRELAPIEHADNARSGYLDSAQRSAFANAGQGAIADFIRGLSLLPLRPGALAHLNVSHYESRLRQLKIGKDKSGRDRSIELPGETSALFDRLVSGKGPDDPIFTRADGARWNKDSWKGGIKDAAARAGVPAGTVAYTLRHSVITDLVHGGLDTLTVAQLSGTSLKMIEQNYGHWNRSHATAALGRLVV